MTISENAIVTNRSRIVRTVGVLGTVLCAGIALGWSVRVVFEPTVDPLAARSFTYASVEPGTVESSIELNAVARKSREVVGQNRASGVVTRVAVRPGAKVSQGSVLYYVNLRPVVVAKGAVPAFRAISSGLRGPDVAQAQQMLAATGFYKGEVDGYADAATADAIADWQESQDLTRTGRLELGDVIFVPALPVHISLAEQVIARGKTVAGGEDAVRAFSNAPQFVIPATQAQAELMPPGTRVDVTAPDGTVWHAKATTRSASSDGQTVTVTLEGKDGKPVCLNACDLVPAVSDALLPSKVIVVAPTRGLVVPSSALLTQVDGSTAIAAADGARVRVSVGASAHGLTVIDGVAQGTRVRVPGSDG